MTLVENSVDSLNESLEKVRLADSNDREWKFAILHVVHSIFRTELDGRRVVLN
ncbi:MAG TPA: hypothetical protein VFF32_02450 [Dermatophilaceae bacterium]|nr:hypothetical protein [Dermatophilaceae bacterium]